MKSQPEKPCLGPVSPSLLALAAASGAQGRPCPHFDNSQALSLLENPRLSLDPPLSKMQRPTRSIDIRPQNGKLLQEINH